MLPSSALLVLLLDPALADRGSNSHFLTDRFSAGHIVTGRAANFRSDPQGTTTRVDIVPNGLLLTLSSDVMMDSVEVRSEIGEEEVELVELDAWLHGSVILPTLHGDEATLELVLYDANSMELKRFTNRAWRTSREFSWVANNELLASGSSAECASRTGCTEVVEEVDVDVIGTALLDSGTGYALGLDLAGADLYNVAYASVTVSEQGAATCTGIYDRLNNCSEWSYEVFEQTFEVDFDEVGSVWGADLRLRHYGEIDVRAPLYKTESNSRYRMRFSGRPPWLDGGSGVNVQSIDEDPLTGLGITMVDGGASLTVLSEGWSPNDALPIDAEVELSTGEILVIPVESYQRKAERNVPTSSEANELFGMIDSGSFRLTIDGRPVRVYDQEETARAELTLADFDGGPLCSQGTCVTFVANTAGGYDLTAMQYRWDNNFISGETDCVLTRLDRSGGVVFEEEHTLTFEEELTATFSTELSFEGDAVDQALAGKVSLRGEPNRRGRQSTLAKGKFYSVITRDGDGDLSLGGTDKDLLSAAAETDFAVLLQGPSSSCGDDENGYYGTWPRVATVSGSGGPHVGVATCAKVGLACRD